MECVRRLSCLGSFPFIPSEMNGLSIGRSVNRSVGRFDGRSVDRSTAGLSANRSVSVRRAVVGSVGLPVDRPFDGTIVNARSIGGSDGSVVWSIYLAFGFYIRSSSHLLVRVADGRCDVTYAICEKDRQIDRFVSSLLDRSIDRSEVYRGIDLSVGRMTVIGRSVGRSIDRSVGHLRNLILN